MTECLFYGGKGGVGKTTCAAATALKLADTDTETLVVSTDPAHSLSDSLETDLDGEPTQIREHLHAVEIDPETQAERYENVAKAIAADLRSAGISLTEEEVEQIFAAGTPAGGDELAALDLLAEYTADDRWEYVVFDTAPTGHTLRLFDLPEVMGLALETTDSLRGQVRRLANSARTMTLGPLAALGGSDEDTEELERMQARMERALDVITDDEQTAFRIVLIPERMAISESERLIQKLGEADVTVDRLVVNKVLEDAEDDCSRCQAQQARHGERVAEIEETFDEREVTTLPEAEGEIQGIEALESLAEQLPDPQ